jgi:hypothetical protein
MDGGGQIGFTSLAVGLAGAIIAFGSAISPELGIFGLLISSLGIVFGTLGFINCLGNNLGGAICNIIGTGAGTVGAIASAKSIGWI